MLRIRRISVSFVTPFCYRVPTLLGGRIVVMILAALVVFLDQASKFIVRSSMAEGASIPLVKGVLYLTHVRNTGAAFGLFAGKPLVLAGVSVAIIAGVGFYYYERRPSDLLSKVALGLALGGAVGNLIDRLLMGKVTDFLDLNGLWPVFNLADMAVDAGAFLLVIGLFMAEDVARRRKTGESA